MATSISTRCGLHGELRSCALLRSCWHSPPARVDLGASAASPSGIANRRVIPVISAPIPLPMLNSLPNRARVHLGGRRRFARGMAFRLSRGVSVSRWWRQTRTVPSPASLLRHHHARRGCPGQSVHVLISGRGEYLFAFLIRASSDGLAEAARWGGRRKFIALVWRLKAARGRRTLGPGRADP